MREKALNTTPTRKMVKKVIVVVAEAMMSLNQWSILFSTDPVCFPHGRPACGLHLLPQGIRKSRREETTRAEHSSRRAYRRSASAEHSRGYRSTQPACRNKCSTCAQRGQHVEGCTA